MLCHRFLQFTVKGKDLSQCTANWRVNADLTFTFYTFSSLKVDASRFLNDLKTITECLKQVTRLIIPEYFSLASQTFFVVCDAAEKP